ncbi:hypothetical protein [Geodermatophilus sp. DSM 44513]|uniref:hypothetical protein n=1 Tax=Geodermatophilus sp. DSM 44513 TaxID=1528104 RepID=UPI001412A166|nr:hypothetical protein [Geodermatophilus sp. DSM 44513]WNV74628.1 hypothetical protein RTG05_16770 [Geodermatophilus sp. DSM 44513]
MAEDPSVPLWRQAFDAVEQRVTPHAEEFVRTETFAVGAALARRAVTAARDTARGATTRFWHLIDLPAGTDVNRLRAQVGALDREVRRLTLQLENERRAERRRSSEENRAPDPDAVRPDPPDGPRPRPARRRAQRPARP